MKLYERCIFLGDPGDGLMIDGEIILYKLLNLW